MDADKEPGEEPPPEEPSGFVFLTPEAVPVRKNQMMAAGLAVVAVLLLVVVVTMVTLIHDGDLSSLLSNFA